MRSVMGISAAAVAAALLLAPLTSASADEKQLVIGVSHQGLGSPYPVAMENGEHKAATEAGVKTIDIDAHFDTLTQANDIDKLIAQKVDGIVIDPGDSIAAVDWVDKAKAAGIPIVSMGVWVGNPQQNQPPWVYGNLLALADRNDIEQSYALGKQAVADNPKGGKVAIVEGLPGFAAVIFRTRGFEQALKESGQKFDVVAQQPGNWDPEKAHQICQDALNAHPDITIIFSHDQSMAQGCLPAIKAANSKAKIYTLDISKDAAALIHDGAPIVTTCSYPETSGYEATKALINYIKTKTTPADKYITYKWTLLTKDNLDSCPPQF